MYEWNEDEKQIDFSHNPFSMPQGGLAGARDDKDPLDILAFQYDIVCNGVELSSGAIRNHRPDIMQQGLRDRRLWRGACSSSKFGGMLSRLPLRRAAAWRHRAGHRPHRHAARRRGEPARGRAVPDEPAGRGPADGRAVARSTRSSCASCISG